MYTPKLRPQIIKQQDEGSCCTIRCGLLIWAILRLLVSALWTGTIMLATIAHLHRSQYQPQETNSPNYDREIARLWFDMFAVLVLLVEFGMIVTFLIAGIKKSVSLYRAYYRYCILTLVIYIIAMILVSILDYDDGHYFGEVYLTYHINEFPVDDVYFYVAFVFATALVIGMEILLICLIKKLIKRYSITTPCQNV